MQAQSGNLNEIIRNESELEACKLSSLIISDEIVSQTAAKPSGTDEVILRAKSLPNLQKITRRDKKALSNCHIYIEIQKEMISWVESESSSVEKNSRATACSSTKDMLDIEEFSLVSEEGSLKNNKNLPFV